MCTEHPIVVAKPGGACTVEFNRLRGRWEVDVPSITEGAVVDAWMIPLADERLPVVAAIDTVTFPVPFSGTLVDMLGWVNVAGSTATEYDVRVNGVSVFTSRVRVDAGLRSSDASTVPFAFVATAGVLDVVRGDVLEVDVVHAGVGATGPKLYAYIQRTSV